MKKQITLFILVITFFNFKSDAQDSCVTAFPVCTGTSYDFDSSTGIPAPSGPDYGCLGSVSNPLWFSIEVGTSGSIVITGSGVDFSSNPVDIDFIYWGPFPSLTGVCYSQLDAAHILYCDYSTSNLINVNIPSAVSGNYYIGMVSNFSDIPADISYSQTSGTGTAACVTTNLNSIKPITDLNVYPNPTTNGIFEISFEEINQHTDLIEVMNMLGRIIYKEDLGKFTGLYKKQIDLTSFHKGIYLVKIAGETSSSTQKIIYN